MKYSFVTNTFTLTLKRAYNAKNDNAIIRILPFRDYNCLFSILKSITANMISHYDKIKSKRGAQLSFPISLI